MSTRFHQIEIGKKFQQPHLHGLSVFVKSSKSGAHHDGAYYPFNSQASVVLVENEVDLEELDFHTTEFTEGQLAEVIRQIVQRAQDQYGAERINAERLTKGLYCAHRAKPIRLIALLHTCNVDFPSEILYGVYRHYDPTTDTMRGGWTAQHSEPHTPSILDLLFSRY
jgi:hypothetical protein